MKDKDKTKDQLIDELSELRHRNTELETKEFKHRASEEKLTKTKARLDFLLSKVPAVIYSSKTSGEYAATYISENVEQQMGYKAKEFLNHTKFWINHVHPKDRSQVFSEVPRLFKKGHHIYEYRWKHKRGTYRWMRDEMRLIYDAKGVPLEIVGYWTDITEHKRVESALQESEKRYRKLFESVPVGTGLATLDGQILSSNDAACKITGFSREELKQINLRDIYQNPEDRKLLLKCLKKEGFVRDFEVELKRKDGTPFYASLTITRFPLHGKKVLLTVIDDISKRKKTEKELQKAHNLLEQRVRERTSELINANKKLKREIKERKHAEKTLRESEERYRTLFESVPVGIGLATYDGKLLGCNSKMCQITGYSENELRQINLKDTYKNPKERSLLLRRLKKDGMVSNLEVELNRKDDTPYLASLSLTPFISSGKKVLLTVAEDITERKQAKEALEQKNIALREIIAQIEIEKRRIEDDIRNNADLVLSPILEKLKNDKAISKYANLLQHHLEGLTSSYGRKLRKDSAKLTPRQIEVCNLIKGGLISKDISRLLNISYQTVEKHRKNIRHKLGISNKGINLTSFLREL
jgi:PAS domain S-box-containing protein